MEAAQVAGVTGLSMAEAMELLDSVGNNVTEAVNKHFSSGVETRRQESPAADFGGGGGESTERPSAGETGYSAWQEVANVTGLARQEAEQILLATGNDVASAITRHFNQPSIALPSSPHRTHSELPSANPHHVYDHRIVANAGIGDRLPAVPEGHDNDITNSTDTTAAAAAAAGCGREDVRPSREQDGHGTRRAWIASIEQQARAIRDILSVCESTGEKFTDTLFPPSPRAFAGTSGGHEVVKWCRPGEFCDPTRGRFGIGEGTVTGSAYLFKEDMVPSDVIQGRLKDCWLLGAMTIVAARARALQERVRFAWLQWGLYAVELFLDGSWISVIVDDLIPCGRDGRPVFGRCFDNYCVWVPIMEKAYAKLMGGYAGLEYGSENDGLVALTGGIPKNIDIHEEQGMLLDGSMWARLVKYHRKGHMMGCANHGTASDAGNIERDHAYAILAVHDVGGFQILQLRNPWGRGEWTGRFSRDSPMWHSVPRDVKQAVGYEAWQSKRGGGSFFICWEDFYSHFDRVHVCKLIDRSWEAVTIRDCEWKGETAGGCNNHATCSNNPQFRLIVSQPTELRIRLFQTSNRSSGSAETAGLLPLDPYKRHPIGIYLLRVPSVEASRTAQIIILPETLAASTKTFFNSPQVSIKTSVTPASGEACFIIVPCTYLPGQDAAFAISVSSSCPVVFEPILERLSITSLWGEWDASSGGCLNNASWRQNPSFSLCLQEETSKVHIVLEIEPSCSPPYPAIGLYCFRANGGPAIGQSTGQLDRRNLVCSSPHFVHGSKIILTMHTVARGDYVIVPTTFRPGEFVGRFRVVVSTEPKIQLALNRTFTHNATQRSSAAVAGFGGRGGVFHNPVRPGSGGGLQQLQRPSVAFTGAEACDDELALALAISLNEQ